MSPTLITILMLVLLLAQGCRSGDAVNDPPTPPAPDDRQQHDSACDLSWQIGTELKYQRWEYTPVDTVVFIDSNRVIDTMTHDGVKTFMLLRDRLDRVRNGVWEVGVMSFGEPFKYGWWQLGSCNKSLGDTIGGHTYYDFGGKSPRATGRIYTRVFVEDTIITVAAGTFHCQGTLYTEHNAGGVQFRHYFFFTKGIGLIKSEVNLFIGGVEADDSRRYYAEEKSELLSIRL